MRTSRGVDRMQQSLLIGYLGADWWGSDARALAGEFRRSGHLLIERHYEDHFPTRWRSFPLRAFRKLCRSWMSADYNRAIEELLDVEALDCLVVFKGMLLRSETLLRFSQKKIPIYCVYPDVSFRDHGQNIWNCVSLYDCIFTTKSFHIEDSELVQRAKRLELVRHGYDPDVHRPVQLRDDLAAFYGSDVAFVGVWSPKKEAIMRAIVEQLPNIKVKIWGNGWDKAAPQVQQCWAGRGAYGDELAAIYCAAKINLGLLSEAGKGTTSGDRTTARTWQIPGCGAFLLHEDTAEVRAAFQADEEVGLFTDLADLARKIHFYLEQPQLRLSIQQKGHARSLQEPYSYRAMCEAILRFHFSKQPPRKLAA